MSPLTDRIENVLNETRMLLLGPQVLLGFSSGAGVRQGADARHQEPELSRRIKMVLVECRMALPGAQAFLGFQLAIVFTQGFDELLRSSQLIHFGSFLASTIAIVLLIAPAAYHRVAEGGRYERFHGVAARFLLVALVFLAPGMAGEALVVTLKVAQSTTLAITVSLVLLLAFYGLWFGVGAWNRHRDD